MKRIGWVLILPSFLLSWAECAPLLTLNDVIAETIKYQWSIQTSQLNIETQAGLLQQATGAFNPLLSASMSRIFQHNVQSSIGAHSNQGGSLTSSNLGLQALTRLGTTYDLTFTNTNTDNPTALPRTDNSNVTFSITQPLLRNLIYSPTTVLEKTQKMQLKAARLQNIQNIANAIASSLSAYWQFVATKKLLKVQRDVEERLCTLAQYATELVKEEQQGYASLYQPRADLALATASRVQAEQDVRTAYNNLLLNMGMIPDEHIEIPDVSFESYPIDKEFCGLDEAWYEDLASKVIDTRADLVAARILIEIADLNLKSARNSLLPELNLVGAVDWVNTTASPSGDLFDSSSFHRPERDVTVGFSFSFPTFNDVAKGLVRQQRAARQQAVVNRNQLESQIISSFKTAFTSFNNLYVEVRRAQEASEEYRKTVETELLKLAEGLSTYFVYLQLQTNWQSAEISQIAIENLFTQNLIQLWLLSGTLCQWNVADDIVEVADVRGYPGVLFKPHCMPPQDPNALQCDHLPDEEEK